MNNIIVVFEGDGSDDAIAAESFTFGIQEAFAVRLSATCTLKRTAAPKLSPTFAKNIERATERAKKHIRDNYRNGRCLYLTIGALPLKEKNFDFTFLFSLHFAFFEGRIVGTRFNELEEAPPLFASHACVINAGVARILPVALGSTREIVEARGIIEASVSGLETGIKALSGDTKEFRRH